MTRPHPDTIPDAFKHYVANVDDLDVIDALRQSSDRMQKLVLSIPEEKGLHRYAEGKWTIKEVLNHLMDVERVMAYRALRFSRADQTELHGFEENDYGPAANAHARTIAQFAGEMERLRMSTIDLFLSCTPEMLQREGMANKKRLSVISLGYIIAGHDIHHLNLFEERYLKG